MQRTFMKSWMTICFCLAMLQICVAQDWSKFEKKDFTKQIADANKKIEEVANVGPFRPNWPSLENYEIPEWYKDAKLGIFIHWGVYCVPEYGWEWYPRQMYIDKDTWRGNPFKHHLETYGPQATFGYKDLIPGLTGKKFDPEQWAKMFKEAGARYVVPVAEHHDGFAMYDSQLTQWNSVAMGPNRDVIGELEKAVRDQGMHFGVSSHRAFNWLYYVRNENFDNADPKFSGLYGRPIPELFEKEAADYKKHWPPHDQAFKDEWLARTCELVDKYNPDLIWFDFGINNVDGRSPEENPFAPHLQKFAAYFYNHAAKQNRVPVLNYKWTAFPEKAAVLDLERSKLDKIRDLFWQTDTSVAKNSWCYVRNLNYKPANRLIDDLVDIVSKNGCLLLNVCPRSDGTIPEPEQELLREIGAWLRVNGEAIYETRPFKIFGEGPTGTETGHISENKNKPFVAKDIRFTTKDKTLYAIALDIPQDRVVSITSLKTGNQLKQTIEKIALLGSNAKLSWQQTKDGLQIRLPDKLPCKHAITFRIQ